MGMSKIAVDLQSRTFEIEVPDDKVEATINLLQKLFSEVPVAPSSTPARSPASSPAVAATGDSSQSKTEKSSGKKKSNFKPKTYGLVDLGLTTEQRKELNDFYVSKKPSGQNEQVAVLAIKLKEFLGRAAFSGDEIHSAFKVVNKPTPKNLASVMGNMKRDGKAGLEDGVLQVNNFTEDFVNFHMAEQSE